MAKFNKKFSSPILANILKGSLIAVSISLILSSILYFLFENSLNAFII